MAEQKNKPEIRFAGFDEPWEQRTLGEIGDFKNGMNFEKRAMGHGYPFVNLQDVFGRNTIDNTNLGLAESSNDQRQAYSLKRGDVLFIRSSVKPEGVGEAAVILEDMIDTTYSGFIIRYRTNNEMNDSFKCFVYSTKSIRKQILSSSTSSANTNINQDSLQNIVMNFPRFPEQSKIGSLFQTLDTLITLRQRKYDKLLTIKKALLEKMFPRDGATLPELRFAGFDEPWENNKIMNICSISTGKSNTQDRVDDGKYPFYVRSSVVEKSNRFLYDEEAVLTVGDGVGTGKVYHYVNGKYDLHQRVYRMYDFNGVVGRYFYYFFSEYFYKRVMSMTAKTSVDSVRLEMISDMSILYSSCAEQTKIGTLFHTLDTLITLQKQELDKLRQLKKALLEKMFV